MISDDRFRRALATAVDAHAFQHVPVDWWDEDARVWRPSVLELGLGLGVHGAAQPNHGLAKSGTRTHAAIVAPDQTPGVCAVSYVAKPVAITQLRPSRLVDEHIAQFFTTRYTLELMDTLMPCIDMASEEERAQLDSVLDDLIEIYTSSFEAWLSAFAHGDRGDGSDTADTSATWRSNAVATSYLPRRSPLDLEGRTDIFSAVEAEAANGAIDCSPVACWDDEARIWRPTMMLGATGHAEQFHASARARVLTPGAPVDVITVSGGLLQPLEIAATCFSLIAIPVLARDFLRMHDALITAGFEAADAAAHPFLIAFAKMLSGAAEEWTALYDEGLSGPAPEPRVTLLPPAVWGFTGEPELHQDRV